tara:strand:+ start:429 stop:851 length:423 start_codon:yes stop_codon:yes gene_type:complete
LTDEALPPLISHGGGYAWQSPGSFLPSVGTGRHFVDPLLTSGDDVGGDLLLLLAVEMAGTADGYVSTRGMEDPHVPIVAKNIAHVALVVRAWLLGGQQIAGHRIVTARYKCVADGSAIFTRDQDFHSLNSFQGIGGPLAR